MEEILRYTSVIQHVTRTVLRPQTLASTGLYPGDLLCVPVASANRDEEVFTEPDTFRIDRDPNPPPGVDSRQALQLRPTGRNELTE